MPRCLKDTLEQRGGMKGWSGRGEKGLEGGEGSGRGRREPEPWEDREEDREEAREEPRNEKPEVGCERHSGG